MSLAKDSVSVFTTRILVIFLSMIGSILVARVLGPSQRGSMEILLLVPYLIVNFGNLGIGNANLNFIGRKKYSAEKVVANSSSLAILMGAPLLLIAYVFFYANRDSLFQGIPVYYAHLVFLIIPSLLFQKFIQYALLGKEDIRSRNIIVLVPVMINFLLTVLLTVVFRLGLAGVLIASLVSNLSAFLLCAYFIGKEVRIGFGFDLRLFLDSVSFGIIPFLSLLVMNLNFRIDVFLIQYFLDSTAVGCYSVAVSVVEKFWLLPEAVGLVLFARVSNTSGKEANRVTPLSCRMNILATLITGMMMAVGAKWIIPLAYGADFTPSVRPLLILLPGIIFMTIYLILNSDLTGRGKAKITLFVFLCALMLNIVLNLIFIPRFGIDGAAASSTISYSLGSLSLAVIFSRMNGIPFMKLILLQREDYEVYLRPFFVKFRAMASEKSFYR